MILVVSSNTKRKFDAAYHREYAAKNRQKIRENKRDWDRKVRDETISRYGNKCCCCKERLREFLGLYPMKGTLMPETKLPLILWAWSNGFPEGFRVLCRNCATSLERFAYCPHKNGAV